MTYNFPSEGSLDYFPCQYGNSRVFFRGPRRDVESAYVAILGGTETYGKFVPVPYPDIVEHRLGLPVVNLGCVNVGLDLYLNDPAIARLVRGATLTVVQITGAHNLSNLYYKVHPRRNDRFLGASPALRSIFPRIDFTEFNFTRHMLLALQDYSRDRFEVVAEELRSVWVSRMQQLLGSLRGPSVLLWMSDSPPPAPTHRVDLLRNPVLVDGEMIAAVRRIAPHYVEVVCPASQGPVEGMVFAPMETHAAKGLPGPDAHRRVADQLMGVLRRMM